MTGSDQNLRRLMRADTDRGLGGAFQQSSPAATESDDAEQTFLIAQGDTEYEIEALDSEDYGGRTVEEFYGYGDGDGASANTPNGMEEAELSQLFFYDGPETTSLVVIHDEPNTGDGGSVTMKLAPLPREGEWAVPDDPWDVGYEDGRVTWNWFPCCTDGGVYKGGFETPFWTETFADFREGIDSEEYGEPWVAVDGSGGGLERLPLDPNEPVVTASAGVSNISVDDPQYEIKSSGKFCVSVDPDQNVCVSRKPILQLGRRECTDVGGKRRHWRQSTSNTSRNRRPKTTSRSRSNGTSGSGSNSTATRASGTARRNWASVRNWRDVGPRLGRTRTESRSQMRLWISAVTW
ncbi:hypothetical protein BRC81_09060 [Halobacteriales archaeon QS_1_68_20]|nr:MAG: hypothetical protein BRC81_09060 [Halobacteriales archaeon QS_1_68_20]